MPEREIDFAGRSGSHTSGLAPTPFEVSVTHSLRFAPTSHRERTTPPYSPLPPRIVRACKRPDLRATRARATPPRQTHAPSLPACLVHRSQSHATRFTMEVSLSVLGAGGVGKSALTIQYVFNRYEPVYDPTIEDMYKRQQEIDGETSMLSVLDTAGQEEFFAMRDSWIRNGDCFVLVYSITSRSSFEELKSIYEAVHRVKDRDEETGAVPRRGHVERVERVARPLLRRREGREVGKSCDHAQAPSRPASNKRDCLLASPRKECKQCSLASGLP